MFVSCPQAPQIVANSENLAQMNVSAANSTQRCHNFVVAFAICFGQKYQHEHRTRSTNTGKNIRRTMHSNGVHDEWKEFQNDQTKHPKNCHQKRHPEAFQFVGQYFGDNGEWHRCYADGANEYDERKAAQRNVADPWGVARVWFEQDV